MVGDDGIPKLIDVGISQMVDVYAERMGYATSTFASSLRWSAPELLAGYPKSEKSDVYALASTYIEVGTLDICFLPNPSTERCSLGNYTQDSLLWFQR